MTAAQTPSLSRSSSPYRRSPMAEIDENSLRNNNGANHHKVNNLYKFRVFFMPAIAAIPSSYLKSLA